MVLSPAEAYGEYRPSAVMTVPKSSFKHPEYLELGLQFEWTPEPEHSNENVEKILVFIKEIRDDVVVLDANHPLAGKHLHFDIHVLAVREPTAEELESIKTQ
jgi:FKBP-type peptidyl-prolyl cis-trans isomerase SlyD